MSGSGSWGTGTQMIAAQSAEDALAQSAEHRKSITAMYTDIYKQVTAETQDDEFARHVAKTIMETAAPVVYSVPER